MTKGKRIFTLIVALTVFASLVAGVTIFVSSNTHIFRSKPQTKQTKPQLSKVTKQERTESKPGLCRSVLDESTAEIYDTVAQYVNDSYPQSFWLSGASVKEFDVALEAFLCDHPEVFWLDPTSAYSYYEGSESLQVELSFSLTGDELAGAKQSLDAAVQKALSLAPDNSSDLETEVYINDYLVNHCAYSESADMRHNAYGALVNGEAVCDGYSRAFQLLCSKSGIECTVIEGTSDFNSDENSGHMWNCVKLGGSWYHADVTWNDIDDANFYCQRYFYLNLSTDEILKDHNIRRLYSDGDFESGSFNVYVPECTSTELNYLKIYCPVLTSPEDDEGVAAALISAAENNQSSCGIVIDSSLNFDSTANSVINDGYINEWIDYANRFTPDNRKITPSTEAYTFKEKRVLVIQLNYD